MTSQVEIQNVPERAWQLPRRQFLKRLFGGVAAASVFPSLGVASAAPPDPLAAAVARLAPTDRGDERFWHLVKNQFPLRPGLILMNAANLCPSPYPVIETVFGLTRDVDADASFQNRAKFRKLHEDALQALAGYLGAAPDELVITRNTSEGNNMVINGLTLKKGDEVVLWDQNHPTNNVAWDVRAQRYGYSVKRVTTPADPKTDGDLVKPFRAALSKKTRVLAFSHVSNISGVALPAKTLCQLARERGILTLIDGAQTFGVLQVNLHDIGCDFYTGSAHKWFMGPKEAGILYIRRERIDALWPTIVGVGWERAQQKGAAKFGTLGQRDDATVAAMGKTVEFHHMIGKERVEARVRQLAAALKETVQKRVPKARFTTPLDPQLSAGVVIFAPPNLDMRKAFMALYQEHQVGCAAMPAGIRLSPNIYNTLEEVDRVVAAVASL